MDLWWWSEVQTIVSINVIVVHKWIVHEIRVEWVRFQFPATR
jgi:hypothetical protein